MKQTSRPDLHITIGSHPSNELTLHNEIKLTKAALLYADRVKIYSLTSSALGMVSQFNDLPLDYKLHILERVIPLISARDVSQKLLKYFSGIRKLSKKKFLNRDELILKNQATKMLNNHWGEIEKVSNKIIQNSQIQDLDRALKDGVLEFHTFKDMNTSKMVANFMAESIESAVIASTGIKRKNTSQDNKIISEYVEQVFGSLSNGSTYPLFDEQTASLVRAGIRENNIVVPESGLDRGRHVGLVKHLFEYLPTFEDATVDEILDIRKELDRPLTRFRKAIIDFSQDIKSAAWDNDFPPEVDKIYLRDVKPALLDIEESVRSNKLLFTLLKKTVEKPAVLPIGSLFSIAISQISSLPQELAASLGIGLASASIIYEAYDEWLKQKQATEQSLLYFYYGVDKRLSN